MGDAGRLSALSDTGLSASADQALDRFAAMVRTVLRVPVALVSLVQADRQIFPGAVGLPDPWQQQRQTPLSHSFCQQVVVNAEPLVITDARADARVAGNLAITDLHVVGYAGMPLTDADGQVLGSLCAIDSAPRHWTDTELALLADLATACSDILRLRIATRDAREQAATTVAESRKTRAAFDRSQLLLRAAVALADTDTLADVVDAVRELVATSLDPAYVGVSLLGTHDDISLESGQSLPVQVATRWDRYPRSALTPSALAVRTSAPVLLSDLHAVTAGAPDAVSTFTEMGWQSSASIPLPGPDGPFGALTLVWKQPYLPDPSEEAVLVALAGYVAQALQRADRLDARDRVASLLQQAMLTELPDVTPLQVSARYAPAAHDEQVGGDWYDVVRLDDNLLALVVGDVTGHDMRAAARMGRLRSMLRAYLVDRHEPPSALLRRLDHANFVLGDPTLTTAVLGFVQRQPGGGYQLHWSNAGHPSPLLLHADGTVIALAGRDVLLGAVRRVSRTNHTHDLPPGSTLLLYTDGLVETRTDDLDQRKQHLRDTLTSLADIALPNLLDEVLHRLAGNGHEDDIALLALHVPASAGT
ncbi:GAF domain-containing SpoIIE family protein phosphatase [Actinoplanes sp. NPDC051859]|uniref:GAF domain-containing SpoIIE family protein phosphatase n=1 Tax=Actinoplanes sp. NPDC051859 TaxID=3363909 RepID=UPI003790050F